MSETIAATFGRNAKRLRIKSGWSLVHAARQYGISRGYLYGVEAGERDISLEFASRIAKAHGVGVDELLRPSTYLPFMIRSYCERVPA